MAETEAVLLRRFARGGDAEAFAEIVRRYAGLVYSAALRVLADVDRASDIAQDTFLQLAKDAGNVTGSLPGWLHRVATHKAIDQVRRDATRRHREATYVAGRPHNTAEWKEISPHVDEALGLLDPHLRSILIAHFLGGRSTREIGRAHGLSQATISRRIEAGVEQLRVGLRRRGILVAAAALGVLLTENAAQAAPRLLLTELGKIALISGSLAATSTAATSTCGLGALAGSALAAVKANAAAVAVAAAAVIGVGSALAYQRATESARRAAAAPVGVAALDSTGLSYAVVFDPAAGPGLAGGLAQGLPMDTATILAAQAGGPIRSHPIVQGLPGPEAETDPRTYVPGGPQEAVTAVMADPTVSRGDAPGPMAPVANMDSSQAVQKPMPEDSAGSVPWQAMESPYETVMRLRREAMAGQGEMPFEPQSQPAATLGPVVARAELRLAPPFKGSPCGVLGLQRRDTTTTKPAGVRETPPDAPHDPVYFVVRAGDREIQGVTYRAVCPPGNVMLFLDTDGDGLWSDEQPHVGRRLWIFQLTATYEFGPVYLRQGRTEPGGDAFYAHCSDGRWLTFWPAFYRDGRVVLEGRSYRIALVDTDFDGRFNESFVPPAAGPRDLQCDVFAIDFNGDSEFIVRSRSDEAEILPLTNLICIGGRYYGLNVVEDGSRIEFRQADPLPVPPDVAER